MKPISKQENVLLTIVAAFSKLEVPKIEGNRESRELFGALCDGDSLARLCEAVSEESGGKVSLREADTRKDGFQLEVMGQALYLVLEGAGQKIRLIVTPSSPAIIKDID